MKIVKNTDRVIVAKLIDNTTPTKLLNAKGTVIDTIENSDETIVVVHFDEPVKINKTITYQTYSFSSSELEKI